MKKVQIYTDGSALSNPGLGGLAAIIVVDGVKVKTIVDSFQHTTNNRMEILASIQALQYSLKHYPDHFIDVLTDSQYLVNSFNTWMDSWIRTNFEGKKNGDLFVELHKLKHSNKGKIKFYWIRGHSGNRFNEMCDHLAKKAARDNSYKPDTGYWIKKTLKSPE
jgi:ribonuclease HI